MKEKLAGQIMKEFAGLREKTCSYIKDKSNEDKKKQLIRKNMTSKENLNFKIL